MKPCVYCGTEFSDERPYDHCTNQTCVETWMIGRRGAMSIALLPKQGFEVVYRKDSTSVPGRSSGR